MKIIFELLFLLFICLSSCYKKQDSQDSSVHVDSLQKLIEGKRLIIDSLQNLLDRQKGISASLVFLSTSEMQEVKVPDDGEVYGRSYRVEIYLSEIYKTLIIKEVHYFGEGGIRIVGENTLDIEKELRINSEATSSFEFVKWKSPTDFEAKVHDKFFNFQVEGIRNIKVTGAK